MTCKCCGNWFSCTDATRTLCSTCERAAQRVSKYILAIDSVHAAGGCYCRECKYCKNRGTNFALSCGLEIEGIPVGLTLITPDDFCSRGRRIPQKEDEKK